MAHFTIRQLQVFIQAAETLSFARVAENLHLTPSAVSFQVRQIEQQCGLALFERIGRRVALTEAGRVMLAYAKPVLQSIEDVNHAVLALKGEGGGRIRLGLVSTAKYIVPHIVARFRTRYPGVTILLQDGNRSAILGMLVGGSIDLAIMGQPPVGADVAAERFAAHPSVIIAAPTHPRPDGRHLAAAELASEWFIIRESGSGTRALSDRFFTEAGFTPRVAMETSSNEMIKQAVMAGMGLALLSQHTISLERSLGLIDVLNVAGFPVMRSWFVVQRRTAPLLADQAALRQFFIGYGQSIIDDLAQVPNRRAKLSARRDTSPD